MHSFGSYTQGSVMIVAHTVKALPAVCWAFVVQVGVTTFWALGEGSEGILVDGGG